MGEKMSGQFGVGQFGVECGNERTLDSEDVENDDVEKEFFTPIRVYIEDSDAGGIVYYVNYLKFMERARTELLRQLGFRHDTLARDQYQFVVHSANIRYIKPARVDDALISTVKVLKSGKTYLLFKQQVKRSRESLVDAGQVLCEAEIKVACVDSIKLKPKAMSNELRHAFAQYEAKA